MKPLALDLYCKAGGNARGLERAGFQPVGVDIEPQPRYPYPFVQGDALGVLQCLLDRGGIVAAIGNRPFDIGVTLADVAYIWASPPCLDNTTLRNAPNAKKHKDLIAPTRKLLLQTGKPWTIENVDSPRARKRLRHPIKLCGSMFNLGVTVDGVRYQLQRHRLFESNFQIDTPDCEHRKPTVGIYGAHCRNRAAGSGGRGTADFVGHEHGEIAARALGLPEGCMTMDEYSNAIPPAYAHFVGNAALREINAR